MSSANNNAFSFPEASTTSTNTNVIDSTPVTDLGRAYKEESNATPQVIDVSTLNVNELTSGDFGFVVRPLVLKNIIITAGAQENAVFDTTNLFTTYYNKLLEANGGLGTYASFVYDLELKFIVAGGPQFRGLVKFALDYARSINDASPSTRDKLMTAVGPLIDLSSRSETVLEVPFVAPFSVMSSVRNLLSATSICSLRGLHVTNVSSTLGAGSNVNITIVAVPKNVRAWNLSAYSSVQIQPEVLALGVRDGSHMVYGDHHSSAKSLPIHDMVGNWGECTSANWVPTQVTGTQLINIPIHPLIGEPSPLKVLAACHTYYGGSLEYMVIVDFDGFTAGSMYFGVVPIGATSSASNFNAYPGKLVNFADSHSTTFVCEFAGGVSMMPMYSSNNVNSPSIFPASLVGTIAGPLSSPASDISVRVSVLVRAGKNFSVSVPRSPLYALRPEIRVESLNPIVPRPHTESKSNLLDIVQAYTDLGTVDLSGRTFLPVSPAFIGTRSQTLLANVSRTFTGWRGSLRYMIVTEGVAHYIIRHDPLFCPRTLEGGAVADLANDEVSVDRFAPLVVYDSRVNPAVEFTVPFRSLHDFCYVNPGPVTQGSAFSLVNGSLILSGTGVVRVFIAAGPDFELVRYNHIGPLSVPVQTRSSRGLKWLSDEPIEIQPEMAIAQSEIQPETFMARLFNLEGTIEHVNRYVERLVSAESGVKDATEDLKGFLALFASINKFFGGVGDIFSGIMEHLSDFKTFLVTSLQVATPSWISSFIKECCLSALPSKFELCVLGLISFLALHWCGVSIPIKVSIAIFFGLLAIMSDGTPKFISLISKLGSVFVSDESLRESEIRAEFDPSTIVKVVVLCLGFLVPMAAPDVGKQTHSLGGLGRDLAGMVAGEKALNDVSDRVMSWVMDLPGIRENLANFTALKAHYHFDFEFVINEARYLNSEEVKAGAWTRGVRERFERLLNKEKELIQLMPKMKDCNAFIHSMLNVCLRDLKEMRAHASKQKGTGIQRATPMFVLITGQSRVGKSQASRVILKHYLKCLEYSGEDGIYDKTSGSKHDTGYRNQPAAYLDDIHTVSDTDPRASDLVWIMQAHTTSAFRPELAGVDEKGRLFDTPFILATSNIVGVPTNCGTRNSDAYINRINIQVDMRWKQGVREYALDFSHAEFHLMVPHATSPQPFMKDGSPVVMNLQELCDYIMTSFSTYIERQVELRKATQVGFEPTFSKDVAARVRQGLVNLGEETIPEVKKFTWAVANWKPIFDSPIYTTFENTFRGTDICLRAAMPVYLFLMPSGELVPRLILDPQIDALEEKEIVLNIGRSLNVSRGFSEQYGPEISVVAGVDLPDKEVEFLVSCIQVGEDGKPFLPKEYADCYLPLLSDAQKKRFERALSKFKQLKEAPLEKKFRTIFNLSLKESAKTIVLAGLLTGAITGAVWLARYLLRPKGKAVEAKRRETEAESIGPQPGKKRRSVVPQSKQLQIQKGRRKVIPESKDLQIKSGRRKIVPEVEEAQLDGIVSHPEFSTERAQEVHKIKRQTVPEMKRVTYQTANFKRNLVLCSINGNSLYGLFLDDTHILTPFHFYHGSIVDFPVDSIHVFKMSHIKKTVNGVTSWENLSVNLPVSNATIRRIANKDLMIFTVPPQDGFKRIIDGFATRVEMANCFSDKGMLVKEESIMLSDITMRSEAQKGLPFYNTDCKPGELGGVSQLCIGYWYENCDTRKGDCGAPLILRALPHKIMGIHTAHCFAIKITKEDILETMSSAHGVVIPERRKPVVGVDELSSAYSAYVRMLEITPEMEQSLVDISSLTLPIVEILKPCESLPVYMRTKIRMCFFNKLCEFPPSKIRAILSGNDPLLSSEFQQDGVEKRKGHCAKPYEPLVRVLEKYSVPISPFPQDILDCVVEHLIDLLRSKVPNGFDFKNLDLKESLHGIPGREYVDKINLEASPGLPWTSKGFRKKKSMVREIGVQEDGSPLYEFVTPEVEAEFWKVLQDKNYNPRFQEFLKDELVKPTKVLLAPATRGIANPPIQVVLAVRSRFLPFCAFISTIRDSFDCQVGINPRSAVSWTRMIERLLEVSPYGFAADYSKFDSTIHGNTLDAFAEIVSGVVDDGPEEKEIRARLMRHAYDRESQVANIVVKISQGMASGMPITAIGNSLVNSINLRVAWILLAREKCREKMSLNHFEANVAAITYGDDNVVAVNESCLSWYNLRTIAGCLKQFGIIMTDDKKNPIELTEPFVEIRSCTFLKREFVKDKLSGWWKAPLNVHSIVDMLRYTRQDPDDMDDFKQRAQVAFEEMVAHGEKRFACFKQFVDRSLSDAGIKRVPFSYSSSYMMWAFGSNPVEIETESRRDVEWFSRGTRWNAPLNRPPENLLGTWVLRLTKNPAETVDTENQWMTVLRTEQGSQGGGSGGGLTADERTKLFELVNGLTAADRQLVMAGAFTAADRAVLNALTGGSSGSGGGLSVAERNHLLGLVNGLTMSDRSFIEGRTFSSDERRNIVGRAPWTETERSHLLGLKSVGGLSESDKDLIAKVFTPADRTRLFALPQSTFTEEDRALLRSIGSGSGSGTSSVQCCMEFGLSNHGSEGPFSWCNLSVKGPDLNVLLVACQLNIYLGGAQIYPDRAVVPLAFRGRYISMDMTHVRVGTLTIPLGETVTFATSSHAWIGAHPTHYAFGNGMPGGTQESFSSGVILRIRYALARDVEGSALTSALGINGCFVAETAVWSDTTPTNWRALSMPQLGIIVNGNTWNQINLNWTLLNARLRHLS